MFSPKSLVSYKKKSFKDLYRRNNLQLRRESEYMSVCHFCIYLDRLENMQKNVEGCDTASVVGKYSLLLERLLH